MKHKNDYSCIAFFESGKPKKWQYVHKLDGFVKFLNQKHQGWKYLNVYERRTGKYLKRFYPGNHIPPFLALIALIFSLSCLASTKQAKPLNSTFSKTTFSPSSYPMTFSKPTFINGFNNRATILTPSGGGTYECR
jgi:hypothetical protein